MAEMEHLLNVYASSACRRAVAPFLGYLEVPEPRGRLTKGLWLVWEYEGDKTLAYYLRRRDCLSALAADLGVAEADAIPTVMAQIFQSLMDVHAAGLVHRDVKPANIVFAESERRFKLIDLGAAADLRTGTNYKPQETILDPLYCPPEEYVLPTDAPQLSRQAAPLAMAISPILWRQHQPECFDSWSAGIVLLQLGLPFLRSTTSLRNWRTTFQRCDYDLDEWRARSGLSAKQMALLDANDGAGWDLAAALLRPREVEVTESGSVKFVSNGAAPRLTPSAALKHPFLKGATSRSSLVAGGFALAGLTGLFSSQSEDDAEEEEEVGVERKSSSKAPGAGKKPVSRGAEILGETPVRSTGQVATTWGWLKSKLFDLEARLTTQASETQTQTTRVQKLRAEVAAGRASKTELEKEESTLRGMQTALQTSVKELNSVYATARGFVQKFVSTPSKSTAGQASSTAPARAASKPLAPVEDRGEIIENDAKLPSEERDVGKAVAEVATNAIYSGLKLTGLALTAVSDFAAAAERNMSRAQAEAESRRVATSEFVAALADLADPPITADTVWTDVAGRIPASEGYEVLSERQRRQAFSLYVEILQKERRAAAKVALDNFLVLLNEVSDGLSGGSTYEEFAAGPASADRRFVAVTDNANRKKAFDGFISKLRTEEDAAAKAAATASVSTAPPEAGVAAEQLEYLRKEQARLKEEYEKMEQKLKEMEAQLRVQNLVGPLDEGTSIASLESDPDGNIIFKFADAAPGQKEPAERKKRVDEIQHKA